MNHIWKFADKEIYCDVFDPSCHDYSVDKPVWEEIANGHFVYGNQKELEAYRKEYESQL